MTDHPINYFEAMILSRKAVGKFQLASRLRRAGVCEIAERVEEEAMALAALCQPIIENRIRESEAILANHSEEE